MIGGRSEPMKNRGSWLAVVAALGTMALAQQPATCLHGALLPDARISGGRMAAQAPSPDADQLFATALSRAKKDQKILFLWFSAPG
jgi:hypothetical protein